MFFHPSSIWIQGFHVLPSFPPILFGSNPFCIADYLDIFETLFPPCFSSIIFFHRLYSDDFWMLWFIISAALVRPCTFTSSRHCLSIVVFTLFSPFVIFFVALSRWQDYYYVVLSICQDFLSQKHKPRKIQCIYH